MVKNPNKLLNKVAEIKGLKTDAALSYALAVAPPVISKLRHDRIAVGASLLLRICDLLDMKPAEVRRLGA